MPVNSKNIARVFFVLAFTILLFHGEGLCEKSEGKLGSETEKKHIEPSLLISVKSLKAKLRSGKGMILVDVRNADDFQKMRIPGSINIPLYAVKTKAFLKPGKSVLINEGYAYSELEKTCMIMRKMGFNVWILSGGLNAWFKSGLPVEGGGFYKREINRMPARDYFVEQNYGHWELIHASLSTKKASETMPGSVCLSKGNKSDFFKGFSKIMSRHEKDPLALALIYNDKGVGYQKIESILEKSRFKNIFFLQGGLKEYREYLKQRASLTKGRKKVTRKADCPTCPR